MPIAPDTVLPISDWTPDSPDYANPGITVARNCVPLTQASYGPLPAPVAISGFAPLDSPVYGLAAYKDRNGTDYIIAGTADKLYLYRTGDTSFQDVTNPSPGVYHASAFDPWSICAFGNSIIATNGSDPPQAFDIDAGASTFADLAANAPLGKYACVAKDQFFVLANTTEETPESTVYPQRIHWAAVGNPGYWPEAGTDAAAQVQSDFTDLNPNYGHIRGIASGLQSADIAVFMDGAVYTGIYTTAPVEFSFSVAQGATGCPYPGSIITNRGYAYYLGHDGFYAFDGTTPNPIGNQKIDRWFFTDANDGADPKYLSTIQGSADPTGKLVFWSYCGPSSNGVPNRLLIYSWALQRWSVARVSVAWLGRGITTGYSLDQLDQFGTLDTLPFPLDSPVWSGGLPRCYGFDSGNNIVAFQGGALAAVIETLEAQPAPFKRCRVTSARPLVDGGSPTITLGTRTRLEDAVTYGSAISMNVYGETPQRVDARYVRARISIPANSVWTHCQGCELDITPSTRR